jgi:uncharacterized cofD-like protein
MNVKRWIALLFLGIVIIALGFAYVLREVYNTYSFPDFVWYLTLQFIPRYVRGTLFAAVGIGAIVIAVWQLNRNLLSVLMPAGRDSRLVDMIYHQRQLKRGPKIVAVGGGTGLSTLLRGLKEHTGNLTAIVTVADDGGSSGRLRRELGVLPPGDFRNCIAALADVEPLMTRLLQYRFSEGSGLEGHSFGNLFIVAMSGVTGNFEQAIRESSRVLAVQGQILPSTLANVTLLARLEGEDTVQGESNIGQSGRSIKQLYLDPEDAQAHPETVRALLAADLIVLGPGSLYTSILPNLMVRGIQDAIRNSPAVKVYVCNVATQPGETDRYRVSDHVEALERHVGPGLFNYVLANNNVHASLPADWDVDIVIADEEMPAGLQLISADVVNEEYRLRHDPVKLANTLLNLYHEHGQNRTESKREVATAAAR